MNFDSKWLDIFKLPLKAAVAGAFAASILWWLQASGHLDLGAVGPVAHPLSVVFAVVLWVVIIVRIVDFLTLSVQEKRKLSALSARRKQRQMEREEAADVEKRVLLGRLDHLSAYELQIVAGSLRDGSPTFYTWVASPPVSALMGKGLVWTSGGNLPNDHYPFTFHDFVWEALLKRKEEFIAKHEEYERREADREKAERLKSRRGR